MTTGVIRVENLSTLMTELKSFLQRVLADQIANDKVGNCLYIVYVIIIAGTRQALVDGSCWLDRGDSVTSGKSLPGQSVKFIGFISRTAISFCPSVWHDAVCTACGLISFCFSTVFFIHFT